MTPRAWMFTDAEYCGGAEAYLEWILDAATPERLGVVAMDSPGLAAWIARRRECGFTVDVIERGSLVRNWLRLRSWGRRRRPELVHVNLPGPYDGLMATAPALLGSARILVTEHLPGVGRVGKRYHWKRRWVSHIERAVALCSSHADMLVDTFGYRPQQVHTVANGVRDAAPPSGDVDGLRGAAGGSPIVVQVGSLIERKGGASLLRGIAGLRDVRPHVYFVGEGPAGTTWRELARQLQIADRVHFAGQRQNVADYLHAADLVTLPSQREGMPLSLLEAMAHGRAVLATSVDGVPDVVVDGTTGWLVPAADESALHRALADALSDRARLKRFGEAGRARHRSYFRLEQMVQKTFELYGWTT